VKTDLVSVRVLVGFGNLEYYGTRDSFVELARFVDETLHLLHLTVVKIHNIKSVVGIYSGRRPGVLERACWVVDIVAFVFTSRLFDAVGSRTPVVDISALTPTKFVDLPL